MRATLGDQEPALHAASERWKRRGRTSRRVVRVSPDVGNRAPSITSEAVTSATVGVLYRYQVTATDPDNDTLVSLLPQDQDPPTGMIIDSETGVITWTPSQEQGDHPPRRRRCGR